jgi:hypothetical protein
MGDYSSSYRRVHSEHEEAAVGIKDPFIHRSGAQTGAAAFAEAEERSVAVDQEAIPGAVAMGDYSPSVRRVESEHKETTVSIEDPFIHGNSAPNESEELDDVSDTIANQDSLGKDEAESISKIPIELKDFSSSVRRIESEHEEAAVGIKDPFIHRSGAQTGAAAFAEAEERSVSVDQEAIPGAVAMGDFSPSVRHVESEHEEAAVGIKDPFIHGNSAPNETEELDEVSINIANQDSLGKAEAESISMIPIELIDFADNQDANEKRILDKSPHDPRLSDSYKKWKAFAKKSGDSASFLRIENYHRHSHVGSVVLGLHRKMLSSNLYYPSWTEKNECSNDGNEPM